MKLVPPFALWAHQRALFAAESPTSEQVDAPAPPARRPGVGHAGEIEVYDRLGQDGASLEVTDLETASGRLTARNRDGDELRGQRVSPSAVPGQTDLRRTDVVHQDVGDVRPGV
ncbi:MAG: hypothetical protein QOH29_2550, partial [Actinomycetota bacterium]|nr:hypothetical protein [Actinomycetota bacterium]